MKHAWLECHKEAQGCLFGKCHVLSKAHSEHFFDLPEDDMRGFISDVQKAAKALHRVTGAVKINYEIHGNSMPHLHVHLFPSILMTISRALPSTTGKLNRPLTTATRSSGGLLSRCDWPWTNPDDAGVTSHSVFRKYECGMLT